jgi:hypothetical protein
MFCLIEQWLLGERRSGCWENVAVVVGRTSQWLLGEMENVAVLTILQIIYSGTTVIITSPAQF